MPLPHSPFFAQISNSANQTPRSRSSPAMPFIPCPICSRKYPQFAIEAHASSCTAPAQATNKRSKRPSTKPSPIPSPILSQTPLRRTLRALQPRYQLSPSRRAAPSETCAPGFHLYPSIFADIGVQLVHYLLVTPPAWVDYRFRRSKNYGPAYNLRRKRFLFGASAPTITPLPAYAVDLIVPRIRKLHPTLASFAPNQLAVSEYQVPGGHILPHNDCENGVIATGVVGVCLNSACTMTLILRARHSGTGGDVKKDVHLPAGSVYYISGDALRVWEHAIFPGNTEALRYSLTFRDVSPHVQSAATQRQTKGVTKKRRLKQSTIS